jgi:hypothetical protein
MSWSNKKLTKLHSVPSKPLDSNTVIVWQIVFDCNFPSALSFTDYYNEKFQSSCLKTARNTMPTAATQNASVDRRQRSK